MVEITINLSEAEAERLAAVAELGRSEAGALSKAARSWLNETVSGVYRDLLYEVRRDQGSAAVRRLTARARGVVKATAAAVA